MRTDSNRPFSFGNIQEVAEILRRPAGRVSSPEEGVTRASRGASTARTPQRCSHRYTGHTSADPCRVRTWSPQVGFADLFRSYQTDGSDALDAERLGQLVAQLMPEVMETDLRRRLRVLGVLGVLGVRAGG